MMRPLAGIVAVLVSALLSNMAGAEELTLQVLQKLKAATVYVAARGGTGTGVLFKKSGTTGWILTCAHVVGGDPTVRVVFGSGTASENSQRANVSGADPYWDLACLVVEDVKDLPEPLTVGTKTEIQLQATAFVAGFPFGAALGMGNKHPEITITVAKVDSILRDDIGQAAAVQLSGEVNPGNSGGPVVDSKGKVIGIAAAKIMGTQTAFAIPGESVKQFLLGSALTVSVRPGAQTATTIKCEVLVSLSDPMGVVKSTGVAYGRRTRMDDFGEPREGAAWKKASSLMKESPLKIDPATHRSTGSIELSRVPADPSRDQIVYQVYWVQGDGVKVWGEPAMVEVNFVRTAADQNAPAKPRMDLSMNLPAVDLAGLPRLEPAATLELGSAVPDLVPTRDGKRILALDLTHGKLLSIATGTLTVESFLVVGDDAVAMSLSPDEKTLIVVSRRIALPDAQGGRVVISATVRVIDPAKLTLTKTFELPIDPVDAAVNDFGALYVAGTPGVVLADMESGKVIEHDGTLYNQSYARFHPDQGRLYLGESVHGSPSHACVLPPTRLDGKPHYYRSAFPDPFAVGGDFEISPDGTRLVSMFGGVLRLSRASGLDMLPENRIVPWTGLAFTPKGDFAFGASADGTLRRYDTKTFEKPTTWNFGLRASRLAFDSTGKTLYALVTPVAGNETAEGTAKLMFGHLFFAGNLVALPVPP